MKFKISVIKKNQILTWGLIIVLVISGYLNYTKDMVMSDSLNVATFYEPELGDAVFVGSDNLITTEKEIALVSTSEDSNKKYFSENRIHRNSIYSEQIEVYENVLKNPDSTEISLEFAKQEILRINGEKNAVLVAENLIKLKGVEDVVIMINAENINVILLEKDFSEEIENAVKSIIKNELNYNPEKVFIHTV